MMDRATHMRQHGKSPAIDRIEFWWDTTNPGWYAVARNFDGEIIDDSTKVWWPVDMDAFGESAEDALREALGDAFDDAVIVRVDDR